MTSAHAALDAGDQATALAHVDAALAIDPNFVAAQTLRERLATPIDPTVDAARLAVTIQPNVEVPSAPTTPQLVSAEGYAKFEQRAKRRRVDRRMDAARVALQRGRLREAAAALDEVMELDANLPELSALTAEFDDLRRTMEAPRRGPWLVAAGVFAATVFAASWLDAPGMLARRTSLGGVPVAAAPIADAAVPAPKESVTAVATAGQVHEMALNPPAKEEGERAHEVQSAAAQATTSEAFKSVSSPDIPVVATREASLSPPSSAVALPPAVRTNVEAAAPVAERLEASAPSPEAAPSPLPAPMPEPVPAAAPPPVAPPPAVVPAPAVVAAVSVTSAASSIDDELLIKQALQRYQRAYGGLDARSARAVYPSVNEAALARAFDGLSSQSLTFDECDVRWHERAATVTCRGSASYVPKIGSREPHVEPRVWTFKLGKLGSDWQIETARASR